MFISEKVVFEPATEIIKAWVAEITGPNDMYKFNRSFLPTTKVLSGKTLIIDAKLPSHGVFEVAYKRIDRDTGEVIERGSRYSVYFFHKLYPIERHQVLFSLFNLSMQYAAFWRQPDAELPVA